MAEQAFIIETDKERTSMFQGLIEESGLEVVVFRDGNEAIHHVREEGPPRLAVVALSLAGASGFAVIREIRKLSDRAHTAVVAVSSFMELRSKAYALRDELGIDAILAGDALAERVQKTLSVALERPVAALERVPTKGPRHLLELDLDENVRLEAGLAQLAREVAGALKAPIALISLRVGSDLVIEAHVDGDALDPKTHPEDWAFCRHPMDAGIPLIVNDAKKHPVFRGERLVQEDQVRSWISAPLSGPSGRPFGAVAVVDAEPRAFTPEHVDSLVVLGRRIAGDVLLRRRVAAAESPLEEAVIELLPDPLVIFDADARVQLANAAFRRLFDLPEGFIGLARAELVERQAARVVSFETFVDFMQVGDGPYVTSFLFETSAPPRRWRWTSRPFSIGETRYQLALCRDVTWQEATPSVR